eukprot:9123482-Pyramimonas_sp.AAC.1
MRDARRSRLVCRFVAVNSNLEVRYGMLGMVVNPGPGGESIAKATAEIIYEFSTKYIGSKNEEVVGALEKCVRRHIHMVAVDAAADEVLGAELMRWPILTLMSALTPNLQIVLRG